MRWYLGHRAWCEAVQTGRYGRERLGLGTKRESEVQADEISSHGDSEVVLVEPDVFRDDRGFFLETYQTRKYGTAGLPETFVQDNHSFSIRGPCAGSTPSSAGRRGS